MTQYTLAFVIERYFEFGGLQRDMRRFAVACAKAGHDVTVFAGSWDGPHEDSINIEIVDFKMRSNHQTTKKMERFVRALKKKIRSTVLRDLIGLGDWMFILAEMCV